MLLKENPAAVVEAQGRGSRVLVLAHSSEQISMQELKLPENLEGIAVIEITDPIREGASDTLEYLRSEGVDLKIISGDNPVTVSYICLLYTSMCIRDRFWSHQFPEKSVVQMTTTIVDHSLANVSWNGFNIS